MAEVSRSTIAEPGAVAARLAGLGWSPADLRRALERLAGQPVDRQTVYRWAWGDASPHGRPPPTPLLATLELLRRLPEKQREALRAR